MMDHKDHALHAVLRREREESSGDLARLRAELARAEGERDEARSYLAHRTKQRDVAEAEYWRLREALRPFAMFADIINAAEDNSALWCDASGETEDTEDEYRALSVGDFRRAREAFSTPAGAVDVSVTDGNPEHGGEDGSD